MRDRRKNYDGFGPGSRNQTTSSGSGKKAATVKHGIARTLSKLGVCSRTTAADLLASGRIRINGELPIRSEQPVDPAVDRIELDGVAVVAANPVYLMLNKPRGLVTTVADEKGRDTVYSLLEHVSSGQASLPWVAPVGRLDKASEGLLLFSNDTAWASSLLEPKTHLDKTYHVQVTGIVDPSVLEGLRAGANHAGDWLAVKSVQLLRQGQKNSWLEIVLDEGKNRQIRRLLSVFNLKVMRLVRVAIGALQLGDLAKGQWRFLTNEETKALSVKG